MSNGSIGRNAQGDWQRNALYLLRSTHVAWHGPDGVFSGMLMLVLDRVSPLVAKKSLESMRCSASDLFRSTCIADTARSLQSINSFHLFYLCLYATSAVVWPTLYPSMSASA